MIDRRFLRILDANFNRCREGLRVCEETARFILEDRSLTAALKKSRHDVTRVFVSCGTGFRDVLSSRNSASDVGKVSTRSEMGRNDFKDIFFANIQRAKESLRVLEEVSKLMDPKHSLGFKVIRFEIYDIEKKSLPKLEALRHHRKKR